MVVLLDLDEEVHDPHADPNAANYASIEQQLRMLKTAGAGVEPANTEDSRSNPNISSFSAALSCWPIVSQIASLLDLNSLDDLSRTCRQFRANLLQFRSQLIARTLRCSNEGVTPSTRLADRLREAQQQWMNRGVDPRYTSRIVSGIVSTCARDMVGECRRCGTVVCRNCTIKPPPQKALLGRHRRLCRTCQKAPLVAHTMPFLLPDAQAAPTSSSRVVPNHHTDPLNRPSPSTTTTTATTPAAFTAPAFARTPCTCPTALFLCQPCGQALGSADTTYMRGWTWRTRYSTHLGGLGTGIGEGNEGVECGRNARCLAARRVETEIDCSSAELAEFVREAERVELESATWTVFAGVGEAGAGAASNGGGGGGGGRGGTRRWSGTSYLMQEIEGIGGVVKKKVRKRVDVGAVVKELESERELHEEYLFREKRGMVRSWCAWCQRVIPGGKDLESDAAKSVSGSSSSEEDGGRAP